MARTETVTCDGCGKVKQAVNHWYQARGMNDGLYIAPYSTSAEHPGFKDYCGQECVIKAVNEYLSGGK